MSLRAIALLGFLACFLSPCLADVLIFKDGTQKKVRIYKTTAGYLSYLADGKIEVVSRDKIKEFKVEGEPLTEKELADALAKSREELKAKVKEEEGKNPAKPGTKPEVKTVTDAKDQGKGVKVIGKDQSKTRATELVIDAFPDRSAKEIKGKTLPKADPPDPKTTKDEPAKKTTTE